jgi:pimeloyl-ACP methyl ester carboxylesterase
MKYIYTTLILFSTLLSQAQTLAGGWQGLLSAGGTKLHIVFNIKQVANTYQSTFDVLEQKAVNIPCNNTTVTGDSVLIEIAPIAAIFKGKLTGNSIAGVYMQGGGNFPVILNKQLRLQTPQPPYAYNSEDVEYDNADKTMHFGATLTKPKGEGPFPVAIIISGSGTQDRDGTLFGHKVYAVLADHLTKNGIAVLRVDDRGAGKTSKGANAALATSATFSYDVEAGINYLESRVDIDKKHIGLIGHSEGGLIAPMVAARRKDVGFIILWGAPTVGGAVISAEQNAYQLRQSFNGKLNNTEEAVAAFKQLHQEELNQFATAATVADLDSKVVAIYNAWKAKQKPAVLQTLGATDNSIVGQQVVSMYNGIYNIPWLKYFVSYNPVTDLRKVTCPVLAITGAKDTQVDAKTNLELISNVLTQSRNKDFKTVELPRLNHMLQTATTGDLTEYSQIEETMSPMALNTITNWVKTHVK